MAFSSIDGIYRSKYSRGVPLQPHLGFVQFMLDRHFLPNCRDDPSKMSLVDATAGACLTREQFLNALHRVGAGLHAVLGIKQGEVVMVMLSNSLYVPVLLNAILLVGSVATTINPLSSLKEVSRQVRDTKPKAIVTSWSMLHKLKDLEDSLQVVVLDNEKQQEEPQHRFKNITLFSKLLEADPGGLPDVRIRQGDAAALLYSSGTTGISKGVVLSHGNLIAAMTAADGLAEELLPDGDVHMVLLPLFHVAGFVIVSGNMLRGNLTFVMLHRYEFRDMLKVVQELKVSRITLAPPVILDLLKPEAVDYDLSSLTAINCGAAPIGRDTISAFLTRYPHIRHFLQGYGMTETSCVCSGGYSPIGASGKLFPNVEAKVVDPKTCKALPPNERGELWIRGPNIMQGYFNNPQATLETITSDGWLRTGDLVTIDEKGYVYVVDRIKELIKYKGYQVAPAELEAVLLNHPKIADCAVVPLQDAKAGEIPAAFIVRSLGSNLSDMAVMDYVASEVAPYKKIRRVFFIGSIPKSPTGKILRKELSQLGNSKL